MVEMGEEEEDIKKIKKKGKQKNREGDGEEIVKRKKGKK